MPEGLILGISIFFVALFGLCFGSFLNVVIYRLPNKMNLSHPRSHCPNCNYQLKWYDNIPVLSYIILRGRCRNCKQKISPRYMIVEILTSILFVVCFLRFNFTPMFFLSVICLMAYICIAFIDLKHYIIPDSLNLIVFLVGLVSVFIGPISYGSFYIEYPDKLLGLVIGIAILLIVLIIERLFNKEIMGGGDIKLIIGSGLLLGWQLLLLGIFIASIIAVIIEIPLSFNKKLRSNHVLPFGPYLVIGFFISLLFGLQLIEAYLSLFNF